MDGTGDGFDEAWWRAGVGVRRCLELAHESLLAGGLPVGAVALDGDEIVAEGRNRAYDEPGGTARLQRTPIAHAELNALAEVRTGTDLDGLTLWSSHEPCAMCAAACGFVGLTDVRFVAPDPSDAVARPDPTGVDTAWVVVASLLFLTGIRNYSGADAPMLARNREQQPEVVDLVDAHGDGLMRPTLTEALAPLWPQLRAAAATRA